MVVEESRKVCHKRELKFFTKECQMMPEEMQATLATLLLMFAMVAMMCLKTF